LVPFIKNHFYVGCPSIDEEEKLTRASSEKSHDVTMAPNGILPNGFYDRL